MRNISTKRRRRRVFYDTTAIESMRFVARMDSDEKMTAVWKDFYNSHESMLEKKRKELLQRVESSEITRFDR